MALAVLFGLTVLGAGFGTLRALGVAKGALRLGLAPAAGLAVLTALATWTVVFGAPRPAPGLVVLGVALAGFGVAVYDRHSIVMAAGTLVRQQRLAVATLFAALLVPCIAMTLAFGSAQVPLSPHDGAYHTEVIEAYRTGQPWSDWYPPGLAALFAAWLELVPWVDSAQGALALGQGLPSLAALAVFGLGVAVWRDLRVAATSALLLSLTYLYPYFPQVWSGWPLALCLVLVVGLWTIGLAYLDQPSPRWGALAGLVLGGVVVVHGSELYTSAIVLGVVLVGALRRMVWRALLPDVGLAALVALVVAAPYLPTLFHWAGVGGAYGVGFEDGQVPQSSASASIGLSLFATFALGALGIDLPLRVAALGVGIAWSLRQRTGRAVVVIGVLFATIASAFSLLHGVPFVRQVYAATFPWGMHFRIFMVVVIAQVLLAGAGCVIGLGWVNRFASRPGKGARRVRRATRLLVVTWLLLMTWGMGMFVEYPASLVLGYSADDAAAMGWLRSHASPGELLANDGYADGGIWAPYKAGVGVLLPRALSSEEVRLRSTLIDNVARLDQAPDAAALACRLHVAYVYYGARVSGWDERRFPPLQELRASPALKEAFTSGDAVVFRTRVACRR